MVLLEFKDNLSRELTLSIFRRRGFRRILYSQWLANDQALNRETARQVLRAPKLKLGTIFIGSN